MRYNPPATGAIDLHSQSLILVAALETVLQRSRRHRRNYVLKNSKFNAEDNPLFIVPYPPKISSSSFFSLFDLEETFENFRKIRFNDLLLVVSSKPAFYLETV